MDEWESDKKWQQWSPYRAVNTLRLVYKNQPVNAVLGNNRCKFWDPYKTNKYTVWAKGVHLTRWEHSVGTALVFLRIQELTSVFNTTQAKAVI